MTYIKRTILATIFVAVAITLASCGGAEERKLAYLQKAKDSIAAENYDKAKIDIKNVLQIDPKNSEATYLFGKIAEIQREYVSALGLYQKAIDLDGNNIDARYSLGKFYLQLAETDKTLLEIDNIDKLLPGSKYAKALRAGVAFSEKRYADAIEYARGINSNDREDDVYILLSAAYYGTGDKKLSKETLLEGIKTHPKSIQLRTVLAKTYMEEDKKDDVVRTIKEIIALESENLTHYNSLSSYYEKLDDKENAKKVYVDLIESDPKNENYQMLMIGYIASRYGDEDAINYLLKLVDEQPDVDSFAIMLSKFELKRGNNEEGVKILENVISRQLTDKGVNNAKNILASIKAFNKDLVGAKKLLNEVLEVNPSDVGANFSMGKILLSERNPGDAVGPLRIVIRENAKNSEAYILLAKAHEMLGESDLAYNVISRGNKELPNNQALVDIYVRMLLEKGEHKFAMAIIENTPKNIEISPGGKYLRAQIYLANEEFIKSEALAVELIDEFPKKEQGYRMLAQSFIVHNEKEKARDVLRKGLDESNSPKLLADYIKIQAQLGEVDEAIKFLKDYPEHKSLAFNLIAELYAIKQDFAMVEKSYKEAINLTPDWDVPYLGLALFQRKQGNNAGAIDTYKTAIEKTLVPNKIRLALAAVYQAIGNIDEAASVYKLILEKEPNNIMAINNFAIALVDEYEDKAHYLEALTLAEKIKDNPNPAIMDTVAWVYAKNEKYNEAVQIFNDILRINSDIGVFKYHLGKTYYLKGDSVLAKRYLKEALAIQNNREWKDDANRILDELTQEL